MKTKVIYIVMAMALILPMLGGSVTGTVLAQDGGSISGHIDNGTSPIPAWVLVWQNGPGNSWVYKGAIGTDGNGNYNFTGLPTGQYSILAQASIYAGEWYNNAYDQIHVTRVTVNAPNNTPNINFSLAPGGSISGHVQATDNGTPISGATVYVYEYGKQTGSTNLCALATTNASGDYTTPGLPAGNYAVQVKAAGYATRWYSNTYNPPEAMTVTVNVGATTPGINFSLAPGASISGHIQAADTGAGIEGVNVLVIDCDLISLLPDEFPVYESVWTDQNGDYVIPGLAAGEYQVRVPPNASLGYARQTYGECVAVTPPVNVFNINFSLGCGGYISGFVFQPDGTTPVERAQINIYRYDSGSAQWVWWTLMWTDMYGHYDTVGLAPQEYKVQVVADGYTTQWYNNVYSEAEATPIDSACSTNTSGINFTLSQYVPPSTDATLSNLTVSQGTLTPAFAPTTTSYSDNVSNSVTSITVTPTVNESHATVTVNGTPVVSGSPSEPISLNVGTNTITIVVTAQDGTTTKTYTVTVTRAAPPTGSISGHIDNGTSPIPGGAGVWVWQIGSGNSWLYKSYTWTDGNGNYSLTGLPTGQYALLVQAGGYASEWYDNTYDQMHDTRVQVTAPNNTPNINFSLAPGGAISGHVQSSDNGTPISGASIRIYENGKQTGLSNMCGVAGTNASGNYSTFGLSPGDYAVQVKVPGYATRWYSGTYNPIEATSVEVNVGAITPGINFSIAPGASISGHIQDANTGAGIERVVVFVFDCDLVDLMPDKFPAYDFVWTDQNGDYVIPGLVAGEYQVAAAPAGILGYSGQRYEGCVSVAPPVNVSNIDFSLECGGYISGYVYQPDNTTPVDRAQINIYAYDSGSSQWVYRTLTWTHMDGHYETIGLPPQQYKVQVVADGYTTQWYDNVYNEAEATPVDIVCPVNASGINFTLAQYVPPSTDATLSNLTVSQGTLTPAFAPTTTSSSDNVSNSVTSITVTPTVNESHATVTVNGTPVTSGSTSGSISLNVGSNLITIVVTAQDGTTTKTYTVTVTRAAPPTGSISGHIDNGTSPIPGGAGVWVWQVGPGDSPLYQGYKWTDGSGNYLYSGLPTGQYFMLAQAFGYAAEWYDNAYDSMHDTRFQVTAPNNTPNINFSLAPGGAISGHVQSSDNGTPISGATIFIYQHGRETGYFNLCGLAGTNASGNYTTFGLSPGDYAVQVKAAGYATKWYSGTYNPLEATPVHVTVGTTTPGINFSLAPGASISGHVQDANTGAGIAGVEVLVFDCDLVDLLPDKFPEYDHAWTNQNGDYVVSGLAAGEYRVVASVAASLGYAGQRYEGCVPVTPPVNVSNIDFSLGCGGSISGFVYQPDGTTPVELAQLNLYEYDSGSSQWVWRTFTWTYMDGHYQTVGLTPKQYKVQVVADGYTTQWYNNVYSEAEATPIDSACSTNTSGINFTLSQYVPVGSDVTVEDTVVGVSVHFEQVAEGGTMEVDVTGEPPAPTTGFAFLGKYYDVSTEASYSGTVMVTITYDETDLEGQPEENLRLYHWTGSAWEDVTVSLDVVNNLITGEVNSLSWFAAGIAPEVTWLPPLSTQQVYAAQDGSTVPIKFQLTDVTGNPVTETNVIVTIIRDSDRTQVFSGFAIYQSDIPGYKINVQTKDWAVGDYTIYLSTNHGTKYGMSIIQKGQAKGKEK
jgi:protocatechuate 3,4-dioxygenase beta subunit